MSKNRIDPEGFAYEGDLLDALDVIENGDLEDEEIVLISFTHEELAELSAFLDFHVSIDLAPAVVYQVIDFAREIAERGE